MRYNVRRAARAAAFAAGVAAAAAMATGASAQAPTARPYERYTEPGECTSALQRLDHLYWRDKRRDTMPFADDAPSLVPALRDTARACAARVLARGGADEALPRMLALAWMMDDDTLRRSVAAHVLAPATRRSAADQALLLRNVIVRLLEVRPVPVAEIERHERMLDSLGPAAGPARLAAHTALAAYAMRAGDLPRAADETRRIRALTQPGAMRPSDQADWAGQLLVNYLASVRVAMATPQWKHATEFFDSAQVDMRRIPGVDPGAIQRQVQQWRDVYDAVGRPGVPVRSSAWFGRGADTTALPRPGRVTVLVYAPWIGGGSEVAMAAILNRLHAAYGGTETDFVCLQRTGRLFLNKLVDDPAAETEMIRRYSLEYLRLPVILGVEHTKFNTVANGRVWPGLSPNWSTYPFMDKLSDVLIIGKDGHIRYVGVLNPDTERLITHALKDALAQ